MKYTLTLLLGTLIALPAICQTKRLVEYTGYRELPIKEVSIIDGMVYTYDIGAPADSATYFTPSTSDIFTATITFRKKGGGGPVADVVEDVDDRDSRIVYGTGWDKTCCTSDPNSPHFNSTISFHCAVGGTFTFTFTGKSVTWFIEKMSTHGIAGVKFDSETAEASIDMYNATKLTKQAVFTKTWPTVGEHKVIIRITGKNPAATANCLVSDSFRIIK